MGRLGCCSCARRSAASLSACSTARGWPGRCARRPFGILLLAETIDFRAWLAILLISLASIGVVLLGRADR
jgi:hypothetical protein